MDKISTFPVLHAWEPYKLIGYFCTCSGDQGRTISPGCRVLGHLEGWTLQECQLAADTLGPQKLMGVSSRSGAGEGWDRKGQAASLPGMISLTLKECFYFESTLGSLYSSKEREQSGKMAQRGSAPLTFPPSPQMCSWLTDVTVLISQVILKGSVCDLLQHYGCSWTCFPQRSFLTFCYALFWKEISDS